MNGVPEWHAIGKMATLKRNQDLLKLCPAPTAAVLQLIDVSLRCCFVSGAFLAKLLS